MPDFRLNKEHEELRQAVREFAVEVIAPVIGDYYELGAFPYDIVRQMGKLGLFGLPFPGEYGGGGLDHLALCLVLEELARVDSSVAITLEAAVSLGAMPIHRYGTVAQRRQWLPTLCSGEALAGFGLSEPGHGSNAGAATTRAELDGDEWVVNGRKAFITNSGTDITELIIITAVTGTRPDGKTEISALLVPSGTPGLTVGPGYSKVGWCASDTHEVFFDNVRVPANNLLGERGHGLTQFLSVLDEGRVALAALATGLAQGCVDESVGYATRRQAFGKRISDFQVIRFKIADMEVRTHLARLAYFDAATRLAAGEAIRQRAAIAKLCASEAAVSNARDATQIHGGNGCMNSAPVARFWRDSKILEIAEGTSEVQRMIIARELGV